MPGRTEKKRGARWHGTPYNPVQGWETWAECAECRPQNAPSRDSRGERDLVVCPRTIYPPSPPLTCTYTCTYPRTEARIHLLAYLSCTPVVSTPSGRINRLFYSSNVKSILHSRCPPRRRRVYCTQREREREGRRSENAGDGRSKPIVYLRLRLCDPTRSLPRHT